MAKKEDKKADILENPEVIAEKLEGAENWIEKHPGVVIGFASVLLLAVAGYFGWNYYKDGQNAEAQNEMFQAIYYFEADSLNQALNGDGNNLGFLDIIDDYGFTDAGNLANFYAGACYLKKGQYDAAILHLEDFTASDLLVQARAYSLIGDAHMEQGHFDDAASFYSKAADYEPNKEFSPTYLMKAALAFEKAGNNDKAKQAYQTVIDKYWDSAEAQNAQKFKAKLEAQS